MTEEKALEPETDQPQDGQAATASSATTELTSTEAAAAPTEPVPPAPEPLTPEKAAAENRRNDLFILAGVLVLAFLLASFKITNPGIWVHLKAGWQIDQQGVPSQDEFSYATAGKPWINLNWLFDWGIYQAELAETRSRVNRLVRDYQALLADSDKPRYDDQGRELKQSMEQEKRLALERAISGLGDSARTGDTQQMRLAAEQTGRAARDAGLNLASLGHELEKARYPALAAYASPGGETLVSLAGTVVAIAIIMVGLAAVLLSVRHPGPTLWWTAVVVSLALIGIGDRTTVSPEIPSLLFLAMLFWILHAYTTHRTWAIWLLIPLEILWVNVHEMFALGFVLAGITLICTLASSGAASDPSERKSKPTALAGAIVLALIGATFLNPFGLKAWQVPLDWTRQTLGRTSFVMASAASMVGQESDWITRTLREGNQLRVLVPDMMSPLSRSYLLQAIELPSIPPLATLILIVSAAISFWLNRKRFQMARLLTFLVCVGTFVYGARYAGVATIAAAIMLALNGQEWYLARYGTETRITRGWFLWSQGGRAATVLGMVVVAIAGITGWLGVASGGDFGFGVNWVLYDFGPTKFLRQANLQGNALNTVATQGNLLLWSNYPSKQVYFDSRAELHCDQLEELETLKVALRDNDEETWRPLLDKYNVSQVLLNITSLADPVTFAKTFSRLNTSPAWTLVNLSSNTAVFGRIDFPEGHPLAVDAEWFRKHTLDPSALVFKENADRPPEPPSVAVNPPTLIDRMWRTRRVLSGPSLLAGHLLNPSIISGEPREQVFVVPTENCLLAIRQARLGLASESRVSPLSYAMLAKAYFYLYNTELGLAVNSDIHDLRRLELLSAISQLVASKPDDPAAQLQLALRYRALQYLDLADKHFDALLRLIPEDAHIENFLFDGGQLLTLSKEDLVRESDLIKNEIDRIKYDVEQLGTQLASPIAKANYLMARGCPGMAIEQLNEAATFAAGSNAVAPMLARLYLRIGQPGDSEQGAERQMMNLQGTGGMRPGEKEELWGLIKLMQGDYDKARSFLEEAIARTRHSMAREALVNLTSDLRGGPSVNLAFSPANTIEDADRRARMEYHLALVFLEAGEPGEAAKHFKQVLEIRNNTAFRPIIAFYLERITGEKLEPLPEPPKDEEGATPGAPTEPAPNAPVPPPSSEPSGQPAKPAEAPAKPPE